MRARIALVALSAAICLGLPAAAAAEPKVTIAIDTAPLAGGGSSGDGNAGVEEGLLPVLRGRDDVAIGLVSTSLGEYDLTQALLDLTQGTRKSEAVSEPARVPRLAVAGRIVLGWEKAVRRAATASSTVVPGLMAESIPGGAAFAEGPGAAGRSAIVAADEDGRLAGKSIGPAPTLVERARELGERFGLVIVELPPRLDDSRAAVSELLRDRDEDELLVFLDLPSATRSAAYTTPAKLTNLTAVGVAGLGAGSITSATTRTPGVISLIDLTPTALEWLDAEVPDEVRGDAIETDEAIAPSRLIEMRDRLSEAPGRQFLTLKALFAVCAAMALALSMRRRARGSLRTAARLSALAFMWWPTLALAVAIVPRPSSLLESCVVAGGCLLAAVVTDRALPWPRGPLLPAAVAIGALTLVLAVVPELLGRSVIGPSVIAGARFYGISNEMETVIPVLALAGLAAAAGSASTRWPAFAFAGGGVALGLVMAVGRLGADVGAAITCAAAFGVAVILALPGGFTRRRAVIAIAAPALALAALIGIDLLTAGGDGHLARNLESASGPGDVWELVTQRYELAGSVLTTGTVPGQTLLALFLIAAGLANRARLLSAVEDFPAWRAAIYGGLAGTVAGALANDSGPVLLINGIIALGVMVGYLNSARMREVQPGRERSVGDRGPMGNVKDR